MKVAPGHRLSSGRRPRRRWLRRVLLLTTLLLVLPAISFTRAMMYPGNAPASVRAVEWVRDHGGGGIVNVIENWVYSQNTPPAHGTPAETVLPARSDAPRTTQPKGVVLPKISILQQVSPMSGEGTWQPASAVAAGHPVLYTSWFRPDPRHTPVVAAAALIPRRSTSLHLVAGTREPVSGLSWPEGFRVPVSQRPRLVAAFNAGWKTRDARGGWYADGRTAVRMVKGAAALVIYRDGHAEVGTWGSDLSMTRDMVAVRQNLALIVQNGQVVPGLNRNARGRWGSAHNQFQYTFRSGIGSDSHGDLIYVAGKGLMLPSLAHAMRQAGVQNGMELDIHPAMVSFNVFHADAAHPSRGHKLLPSMTRPADRYLTSDQRDFFYITAK